MSRHSASRCLTASAKLWRFEAPPIFLAPSLASGNGYSLGRAQFSTSTPLLKRRKLQKRDSNPDRGVSALRRTGLRHPVSMSKVPLPQPVDPSKRNKFSTVNNHRLYGFFREKRVTLSTPEEDEQHGRPWTVEELRHKAFEDLHALWWQCCKERNIVATQAHERKRIGNLYGDKQAKIRDRAVQNTQRAIKHALTERHYAWEDAWQIAQNDPEVDLAPPEGTPAYAPSIYDETSEEAHGEEPEELPRAATTSA